MVHSEAIKLDTVQWTIEHFFGEKNDYKNNLHFFAKIPKSKISRIIIRSDFRRISNQIAWSDDI